MYFDLETLMARWLMRQKMASASKLDCKEAGESANKTKSSAYWRKEITRLAESSIPALERTCGRSARNNENKRGLRGSP
jgi:hypothetical protein